MRKKEKITLVIGISILLLILLFPPVNMNGYSPSFATIQQYGRQYESRVIAIPSGDYGESNLTNVNWTDSRRRLFFLKNKFSEDISIKLIPPNLSKENPAETVEGIILWESEINIGRLLIEIILVLLIFGGIIIYFKNSARTSVSSGLERGSGL